MPLNGYSDAAAQFTPVNIAVQLAAINASIVTLNADINTRFANTGITQNNFRRSLQTGVSFLPRQKQVCGTADNFPLLTFPKVPGNGHALALAVTNNMQQQNFINAQQQATAGTPAPAIGTVPPAFNGLPASLNFNDIATLIIFYNESFDIVITDSLRERSAKLAEWLRQY